MKLEVALRQLAGFLGCEPNELDLDHTPALELRPVENGQHVPHQHDPKHLEYLARPVHKLKTNGRRGESKLSIDSNSDKSRIAKTKRLEMSRMERVAETWLVQPEMTTDEMVEKGLLIRRAPRDCIDCGEGPCYMNCGPVDPKPKPKSQWPQGRKIQSRGFQKRNKP